MQDFENEHDNERVFIVGTGPSLKDTPLHQLESEHTISLNKIGLIFDETTWRPDYYVFDDADSMDDNSLRCIRRGIKHSNHSFISDPGRQRFEDRQCVTWYSPNDIQHRLKSLEIGDIPDVDIEKFWQLDLCSHINNFGSTISVAAQIAMYMGFDRLYFLGCDLYEEVTRKYMLHHGGADPVRYDFSRESQAMKAVEIIKDRNFSTAGTMLNLITFQALDFLSIDRAVDNNHFSTEYESNHEYTIAKQWNRSLNKIHAIIRLASNKYNFDVYNATYGGRLEIYNRVDLETVLSE